MIEYTLEMLFIHVYVLIIDKCLQFLEGLTCNYMFLILVPLGRNAPDIQGLEVEHWANSTKTVLTWNQNTINASHVDIEIFLFDTFEFRLHQASLSSFRHVPNSGSYHLDFSEENIPSNTS